MGRQILLLGIGQMGCTVSDLIMQRINKDADLVRAIAIDTDERTLEDLSCVSCMPMVDEGSLSDVVEKLGEERVKEWFPADWEADSSVFAKNMSMRHGSGLWRMKAYLSFASFVSNPDRVARLTGVIKEFLEQCEGKDIELCTVASLAGGTGSGLFLPVALYVKRMIKSLGGKVVLSRAFFAMPEILDSALTAERKVKAYANAYAAISELNAVNMTAFTDGGETCSLPIEFKIGSEGGVPEQLFDSTAKRYKSPDNAPFNSIILMERVPGVYSVEAYSDIISELVISVCRHGDENIEFENDRAVFMGVSIYKVRYSPDSIVKYIALNQLSDLCDLELGGMHSFAERKTPKTSEKTKRNDNYAHLRDVERYCLACREYMEEIPYSGASKEDKKNLLSRSYVSDDEASIVKEIDCGEYSELVYSAIVESFETEDEENILRILEEDKKTDKKSDNDEKDEKPKRLSAKEKRQKLLENAAMAMDSFKSYYLNGKEQLGEKRRELEDRMRADCDTDKLSLITSVLKCNGEYVHPTFALLKLCNLFLAISRYVDYDMDDMEKLAADSIPETLLTVNASLSSRTRYAKESEARFILLSGDTDFDAYEEARERYLNKRNVFGRPKPQEITPAKLADDEALFKLDLAFLHERLKNLFINSRAIMMLEFIGKIINGYRKALNSLAGLKRMRDTDISLALGFAGSDMGSLVYVGASPEEKKTLLEMYYKTVKETKNFIRPCDARLGKIFGACAFSDDEKDAKELSDAALQIYTGRLLESDFYKDHIDRNVYRAIIDSIGRKYGESGISYENMFVGRYRPLKINGYGDAAFRDVCTSTRVMFSQRVGDYIEGSAECEGGISAKDLIESFMYNAGERNGSCIFDDDISDLEMVVRRDVENFPLHFSEFFNEASDDKAGYSAYTEAVSSCRKYSTQMWNPAMTYDRQGNMPLPLISPKAQQSYELSVAKAVLYSMIHGNLFIRKTKDQGEVFFDTFSGAVCAVCLEDAPITKSQPDKLMYRMAKDVDLVKSLSARYDATVTSGARSTIAPTEVAARKRSILSDPNIIGLADAFAELIPAFYSAKQLDSFGYARSCATVINDAVVAYSLGGSGELDEYFECVYSAVLDLFVARLRSRFDKAKVRAIMKWMSKENCLKQFTAPEGFSDYTL